MFRFGLRALIATLAVAATLAVVAAPADARIGGGFSSGSRGGRSFSAPPSTSTAPSASPFQRSTAQPGTSGFGQASRGGLFGGRGLFGGGLMGGLAAGFLGAGLFGLLFGHGLFGGLGGIFSFLGLIFQVGLIAFIAMALWRFFQRRNQPAYAGGGMYRDASGGSSGGLGGALGAGVGGGLGSGLGTRPPGGPAQRGDSVGITGTDYDAFERTLGEVQAAYGNEDIGALRPRVTPEMLSYFSEDLAQNAGRGVVNRVSDVKLLNGDLSEAWREGTTDYATVAMRFSLHDWMADRTTGQVVEGDPMRPQEVTEFWTFRRSAGGPWILSAIQQV
jgi:predicted lipid-binding transport protein (Tim44 family)